MLLTEARVSGERRRRAAPQRAPGLTEP
jgi:hypothetical protein